MEVRKCVKRSFETEADAKKMAKKIKKETKAKHSYLKMKGKKQCRPRRMSAYLCRYCCLWHLTSAKQRKKAAV